MVEIIEFCLSRKELQVLPFARFYLVHAAQLPRLCADHWGWALGIPGSGGTAQAILGEIKASADPELDPTVFDDEQDPYELVVPIHVRSGRCERLLRLQVEGSYVPLERGIFQYLLQRDAGLERPIILKNDLVWNQFTRELRLYDPTGKGAHPCARCPHQLLYLAGTCAFGARKCYKQLSAQCHPEAGAYVQNVRALYDLLAEPLVSLARELGTAMPETP